MDTHRTEVDSGICCDDGPILSKSDCLLKRNMPFNLSMMKKRFRCNVEGCDKAFSHSAHLVRHARTHTKLKPYVCDFDGCGKAFSQSGNLITHARTHTRVKPYVCDFHGCGKTFSQSGHLVAHFRTHTGIKSYVCDFDGCGKAFLQSGHLVIHARTHTRVKPYVCDFDGCGKAFSQSAHLVTHFRAHTGVKPYVCKFEGCVKSFSMSGHLVAHSRTHTGAKPYVCKFDGCGKSFSESGGLVRHSRTHTGVKPYVCKFEGCAKSFSMSGHLVAHSRTHTGVKPYVCKFEGCAKSFSISGHLVTHTRTHTGVKPYGCEHCSFRSSRRDSLKNHRACHELQASYPVLCNMQDGGTQVWKEGDIRCSIRTLTEQDMMYHIERNHTKEGIASKFDSENKLSQFFDSKNTLYDRDWANRICFTTCKSIEGNRVSARPDFRLLQRSIELEVIFLVGNDEFEHRFYACDSQRMHNIVQALEQTPEFRGVPIVYCRFNPHSYWKDGILHSHKLERGHEILWQTIQSIKKEDIHPGLNLVYVHYDQTDGKLDIFENTTDNDYALLHKACVIKIV